MVRVHYVYNPECTHCYVHHLVYRLFFRANCGLSVVLIKESFRFKFQNKLLVIHNKIILLNRVVYIMNRLRILFRKAECAIPRHIGNAFTSRWLPCQRLGMVTSFAKRRSGGFLWSSSFLGLWYVYYHAAIVAHRLVKSSY